MNISEKIFSLRKKLHDHNYRYYVLDDPLISDYDFDMMLKELEKLERENPEHYDINSPTQRVGGDITKSTELTQGGKVAATVGNDGYLKTVLTYNTGVSDSGHAFSASFSRTAGDGYVDGTPFEGYAYFLGYGYRKPDGKHNLQFIVTGAPQVHGQRTTSYYNMATLADYQQYGIKYNYN